MTFMNIIILTEKDLVKDQTYKISDSRADHIRNILKSDLGDFIQVGILNGPIGEAIISELSSDYVTLEIRELSPIPVKDPQIDIICAIPRPQTLKKVLASCATMGVNHIYLIRSEKVEKSYFHSPLLNEEKYSKYIMEGLSQGKRTKAPTISIHKRFKQFFDSDFKVNNSLCLLAHPDETNYLSNSIITSEKKIVVAIGPEGGWNEYEINYMIDKGFTKFKLSRNILRVENAITASLAQLELLIND